MYLKTPKRYKAGYRERRVVNTRWLWLWIVTPIIVVGGLTVYDNRAQIAPPVQQAIENVMNSAQSGVATMNAPTPMPTENPTARLVRAQEAWQTGAISRAIEEYSEAAPGVPNDAGVYTRIALGHLIEGRNDDALVVAEQAVTADPYSSDAWAVRGFALARNNRAEEGIASALQALALREDDPRALAFLAEAYRLAGQTNLALETSERAIEADPNAYEGYFVRALTNYYSGVDYDAAREDFVIARDLAPNMPYIPTEMAWLEWQYANTDVSMDMLQQVIELNPENLDALYALGYFYYQTYGDPENSVEYLTRCTAADPTNVACLSYLALVQSATGAVNDALENYRRLIDTGTTNPRHYLSAGGLYADTGDCISAEPILRRGYELEIAAETPNTDRIASFESYLRDCQPGFLPDSIAPTSAPEVTDSL
jgi:tetratricopeptide (TPR) repeat protein